MDNVKHIRNASAESIVDQTGEAIAQRFEELAREARSGEWDVRRCVIAFERRDTTTGKFAVGTITRLEAMGLLQWAALEVWAMPK